MNPRDYCFSPNQSAEYAWRELEDIRQGKGRGIPFGIPKMDAKIKPYPRPGELVVYLGRPSNGKTAFLVYLARYTAKNHGPVIFVTAEVPVEVLEFICVSSEAKVDSVDIQMGNYDIAVVRQAVDSRKRLPIYMMGNSLRSGKGRPKLTMEAIQRGVEYFVSQGVKPVRVLIDYAQRIQGNAYDRRKEVSEVVERAKDLALQYGCIVDLGSQVGRTVDSHAIRGLPDLASGKETGNIEETADIVLGLWRPIMYYEKGDAVGFTQKHIVTENLFGIRCMKRRPGVGAGQFFWLHFAPEYNQFAEFAHIDLNEEE